MRLIVTGFGAFQGVAKNPTEQLITYLEQQPQADLLPGVDVSLRTLTVAASAADAFADELVVEAAASRQQQQRRAPAAEASQHAEAPPPPLLIVHLGVAARGRSATVALEACAHNECGFSVPDEDGVVLGSETPCCGGGGGGGGSGQHSPPPPPLGARMSTGLDLDRLKRGLVRRRDARRAGGGAEGGPSSAAAAVAAAYDVVVSEDAGRFLCNYVYARSLHACARLRREEAGRPSVAASDGVGAAAAGGERQGGGGGDKAAAAAAGGSSSRRRAEALFVHVPPFAVMPERAQREALVDLLQEAVGLMRQEREGPTTAS